VEMAGRSMSTQALRGLNVKNGGKINVHTGIERSKCEK
jgi:hypothetical protein